MMGTFQFIGVILIVWLLLHLIYGYAYKQRPTWVWYTIFVIALGYIFTNKTYIFFG